MMKRFFNSAVDWWFNASTLKVSAVVISIVLAVGFGVPKIIPKSFDTAPGTDIAFSPNNTVAQRVSQSVWLVETANSWGSAVAVKLNNKNVLLTAAHVVDGVTNVILHRPLIGSDSAKGSISVSAHVSRTEKMHDFAVLVVDHPVNGMFNNAVIFDNSDYPAVGTQVLLVGCVLGPNFPLIVSSGIVSAIDVNPRLQGWPWKSNLLDYTDAVAWPGCSGGGVFVNGKLAGICVGGIGRGATVYVPVRVIRDVVSKGK